MDTEQIFVLSVLAIGLAALTIAFASFMQSVQTRPRPARRCEWIRGEWRATR